MAIYRFPKDYNRNQGSSEQQFEGKLPDYIYIDDERDSTSDAEEEFQEGKTSKRSSTGSYPFFFRFVTLVGGTVMAAWAGVLLAATLFAALATVLVFWRADEMRAKAVSLWKRACKMSAIALALFVATLSPAFGFGIVALYFAQRGEKKPSFFSRFF